MTNTKIVFGASLFLAFAGTVALLIAGLVFYQVAPSINALIKYPGITGAVTANTGGNGPQGLALTTEEVAKHNSSTDCWMILNNKVYDVTKLINKHSGGADSIIRGCGKDGTASFNTKDKSPGVPHSSSANELMAAYYIGDLNQIINGVVSNINTGNTTTQTTTTSRTNSSSSTPNTPNQNTTATSATKFTAAQVATHSSSSDCWLIINDKVYDVTEYIPRHPAGPQSIIRSCGKDATAGFSNIHSSNAFNILEDYYIGDLKKVQAQNTTQESNNPQSNNSNPVINNSTNNSNFSALRNYNISEVAKHNSSNNCWLIISNKVYNVTSYIPLHPAGPQSIIRSCGKDATAGFNSTHSSGAWNILQRYYIGNLTKQVSNISNPINNSQNNTNNTTVPGLFTQLEVAKHNSTSNCWLTITNKVYNVTAYIPLNQTNSTSIIISYCGKDATPAFNNQNTSGALTVLQKYYLGNITSS